MAGRPSKHKEEYNEQAYKLCLLGATDKELADFFHTTDRAINRWKETIPAFRQSLKAGKDQADAVVASKLYHRAIGYEHEDTQFATFQGEITDSQTYIKHYAPDTTACIFWLKNRQSAKWRDKTEQEISGNMVIFKGEKDLED